MLFETIRVLDGCAERLELHRTRAERSCGVALPGFADAVARVVAGLPQRGEFRLHLPYDATGFFPATVQAYRPRVIRRLRVVEAAVDYALKDEDRSVFEALRARYPDADELLLTRGGLVTDTCFSNVLVGEPGHWVCPADCVLAGTRRESLLREGAVAQRPVRVEDLADYPFLTLINAMLPPGRIMLPMRDVLMPG